MARAQQIFTAVAIATLVALALMGGYFMYLGVVLKIEKLFQAGLLLVSSTVPAITGIAGNAIQASKERVLVEQPKDWKGAVIYVGSESSDAVKTVVERLK